MPIAVIVVAVAVVMAVAVVVAVAVIVVVAVVVGEAVMLNLHVDVVDLAVAMAVFVHFSQTKVYFTFQCRTS